MASRSRSHKVIRWVAMAGVVVAAGFESGYGWPAFLLCFAAITCAVAYGAS